MRFTGIRLTRLLCALVLIAVAAPAHAQGAAPSGQYKNLKVLPQDISQAELRAMMGEFARGLGVRCEYCHVRTESPTADHAQEFSLDDKPTKLKAREMMKMVRDINGKYLATLEHRADPPIKVECVTCHHGAPQPRTLQSVLRASYDEGGVDSTLARYQSLRQRYYGRATYDFGDGPLAEVGGALLQAGHGADAESLLAYNVSVNPASMSAKRSWANMSIANGFRKGAGDGAAAVEAARSRAGASVVNQALINGIAYALLDRKESAAAVAAAQFLVQSYPESGDAYDTLGEVYYVSGDSKRAKAAYTTAIKLDPKNEHSKAQLEAIKHPAKKAKPAGA